MSRRRYMNTIEAAVDMNTLLLLHLDDYIKDDSFNNVEIKGYKDIVYTDGKFNDAVFFPKGSYIDIGSINLGNKDFTIDYWCYIDNSQWIADQLKIPFKLNLNTSQYASISAWFKTNNSINVIMSYNGNRWDYDYTDTVAIPINKWFHVAHIRHSGNIILFVNGKKISSRSIGDNSLFFGNYASMIGTHAPGGNPSSSFLGKLDEFRISDIARWTSDFTPPVKPY